MRLHKFSLTAFILIIFSLPIIAAIEPVEELSFSVPGLDGAIEQFTFNDIDNDNIPEILATDGSILVLYSIAFDSILFSDSIPPTIAPYILTDNYKILFDDVNRDLVPDILFARYTQLQDTIPLSATIYSLDVRFYDGSTNYESMDQINLYTDTLLSINFIPSTLGLAVLKAEDTDNDGYNELIISYETFLEKLWGVTLESVETDGTSKSYYSFPDSTSWVTNKFIVIHKSHNYLIFFGTIFYHEEGDGHGIDPWLIVEFTPSMFDSYGQEIDKFNLRVSHLISGQIIANQQNNNILFSGWYGYNLYLYNFIAPNSLEEVWTLDVTHRTYTNFLYHPLVPGYFFAFEGDTLIQFNGTDGSIYQKNDTLPSGLHQWVYPFDDNLPRLSIRNDNNIKLFRFDISTGINDNNPINLPNQFSLSQNYPNPFNPTTVIEYTLPSKGFVKAEVFNLLGQRVVTLIDSEQSAGSHTINWDASGQSSGMYLIKVSYDTQVKSIKTILLK